jgi:hypothetical protein
MTTSPTPNKSSGVSCMLKLKTMAYLMKKNQTKQRATKEYNCHDHDKSTEMQIM